MHSALLTTLLLLAPTQPTVPSGAVGHAGGLPAVAWPDTPHGVGEIVDDGFIIKWSDYDALIETGTVTLDWYYTDQIPPTFLIGIIPSTLRGTPVVLGVPEEDLTNEHRWDTSSVATGNYWIYSLANEPPEESTSDIRIVAFSRGVVTVAHPGDPVPPAVIITQPDSPYHIAETTFPIGFEAYDPDMSATVTLEASTSTSGVDFMVIAEGLPATPTGRFEWDVRDLKEGNWTLRATIRDSRGMSMLAYSRYFLRVEHPLPQGTDGGEVALDAAVDAGVGVPDAGAKLQPPSRGCRCLGARKIGITASLAPVVLLLLRRRRRAKSKVEV